MAEVHCTWMPTGGLSGHGELPPEAGDWSIEQIAAWADRYVTAEPDDIRPDQMTWIMVNGREFERDDDGNWVLVPPTEGSG